ncbi:MAG: acetyl-CoA carboxylase carboxyl transferase subunit alpha, partial [Simkania sp.]|nr:acetyl-CoA carboxylase carboxyl transferase subunit alpha [Simkania sp.]
GMGVGDIVGMLEHAYYSVISPEGCASILWHDAAKNEIAAEALRMHAEDLLEFGVIDKIIEEPQGGAHHNPKVVYENVKKFILKERERLTKIPLDELLESRYQKFRKLGAISIAETSQ